MYHTIIVGAGITGLQLGALLADGGEKVLVLEKSSRIGGRAAITEKDGFILDYGLHAVRFGPKSALAETCRRLGRQVEFLDFGTSYVLDHDNVLKVFPTSPKAFLTTRLFSFKDLIKIFSLFPGIIRGNHEQLAGVSVQQWLEQNNIGGGARRYFELVSASMMVCPFMERSSAGEMLTNMKKVLQAGVSVMYPRGGWKPLLDLFGERISEQGEIRTSSPVEKLALQGGRVQGVHVRGELIEAEKVVLSIPALELDSLLEGVVGGEFLELCRRTRPTAGISVDYLLKAPVSPLRGLIYTYNPPSFGMFTSNIEPAVAPPGRQLLTWLLPVREELFQDKALIKEKEEELDQALQRLFPGLKEATEFRRVLHLPVVDGVEVNIRQTQKQRPPFEVPGYENLFLVGDSTAAPGAGGDVGHESVHCSYQAIKKKKTGNHDVDGAY